MLVVLVALAALAQDPAPPAGDPPPTTTEAAPADAPPPVVPLEPASPPPVETPPPVEAPPPLDAPAPDARPAPAKSDGLTGFGLGAAQAGIGVAACCGATILACPVTLGLGLVPVVGAYLANAASAIIVGGSIGFAETWAGDAWGNGRAPMAWPVVASTLSLLVGSAALIGIGFAERAAGVVPPTDPTDTAAVNAYIAQAGGFFAAQAAASCLSVAAAILVPVLVYGITETPKQPGDRGQGLPGFTEPARPAPAPSARVAGGGSGARVAMRY